MDWSKFDFDFRVEYDTALFHHIVSIEAYKEAALNLVLPPEWRDQLDRLNRIRAVYGTTALEGNPLSEAEVSHQMDILEQPSMHDHMAGPAPGPPPLPTRPPQSPEHRCAW